MLLAGLAALALCAAAPQNPTEPPVATFRNLNGTFQLELPEGWRQLAPNEAVQIAADPASPRELRVSQPRRFYAVGPVEAWLRRDYSGPWLYVVEQQDAWHVGDDYREVLRASWQRESESSGVRHEVLDVRLEPVGTQAVESVVAVRTSTPPPPEPARKSLDVHAPTFHQQITLSFTGDAGEFERLRPQFERWLTGLTFARVHQEREDLSDRLWTPILTGAVVGLVLVVLYRHTRQRR